MLVEYLGVIEQALNDSIATYEEVYGEEAMYWRADCKLALKAVRQLKQQPAPVMPTADWTSVPEWAQWWAISPDGFAMWYEEEPLRYETVSFCGWGPKVIYGIQQGMKIGDKEVDLPLGIDWRLLKQQRPQPGEAQV